MEGFLGSDLEVGCIISAKSPMAGKCSFVYAQERRKIIWWTPIHSATRVSISELYILFHWSFSLSLYQYYTIYIYYRLRPELEYWPSIRQVPLTLFFYFTIFLTQILLTFLLHRNSRIYLSSSRKSGQNFQLDTIKSSFWTATYLKEEQAQMSCNRPWRTRATKC